jgi:hypothetical protein
LVGKSVPAELVEDKVIDEVFSITDASIKEHYNSDEFTDRIRNNFRGISSTSVELFRSLCNPIRGVNRIWARVIKNSFAPFFSGKFDFVVGNPRLHQNPTPENLFVFYEIQTKIRK